MYAVFFFICLILMPFYCTSASDRFQPLLTKFGFPNPNQVLKKVFSESF